VPFVIALVVGLALTPLARWAGLSLGIVDRPAGDELKIHAEPISLLGGVATVASALAAQLLVRGGLPWPVVAAVVMSLAIGLLDDRLQLPALLRVALIGGAGVILVAGNMGIDGVGLAVGVGVIILVLACANAVNIIDGQDGLAGGVAAIAGLGVAAVLALHGDDEGASLGLALAGGLAAFLVWNRPPARIFLGDGGAYAVGTLLAVLAARAAEADGLRGLLAAGAALGIPAFEVAFSVGRRLTSSANLAGGDRLHSYDLVAARWGRTASTVTFWALGAVCAAGAILVSFLPVLAGAFVLGIGVLLAAWWGVWLWSRRSLAREGPPASQDPG
jgi:UDP-GlcNAc:undecaprenyl-phosphate GlcNAc-1-phosphate transferase